MSLQIGSYVKMNVEKIEKGDLDGIAYTQTGINYLELMQKNPNKIYRIIGTENGKKDYEPAVGFLLDGEMQNQIWYDDELIEIKELTFADQLRSADNIAMAEMLKNMFPTEFGALSVDKIKIQLEMKVEDK